MANNSVSGSRPGLSLTPLFQISKDAQGSDNPIPLSPQWLLPKPGESKPGVGTGESNLLPSSLKSERLSENVVFVLPSTGSPLSAAMISPAPRRQRYQLEKNPSSQQISALQYLKELSPDLGAKATKPSFRNKIKPYAKRTYITLKCKGWDLPIRA